MTATAVRKRSRRIVCRYAARASVLALAAFGALLSAGCTQNGDDVADNAARSSPQPAAPPSASPAGAAPPSPAPRPGAAPAPVDSAALRFADEVLTLDTHVDIPFDFATDAVDPMSADLQVNLEKMRRGGLDAAFFIVYVGQTARSADNYAAAQAAASTKFDAIHRMTDELYPETIGLATSPADVERLVAESKLAAAIGVENGYSLGPELEMLDRFYQLGARYVSLVHNGHNDLADSAMPRADLGDVPAEHGGVSDLGARAIARMNDLGIMVDVSHASKDSMLEAIRLSRAPVIASHSSVTGMAEHPRNMDDETLRALGEAGGVVQIVAFDSYVTYQPPEQLEAMASLSSRLGLPERVDLVALPEEQRMEYLRGIRDIQQQWPPSDVSDFVDHVDYAVRLIGVDHVGISSDFGGGGGVIGWSDASETANVTFELLRRGYSEEDVAKIWSGNLLRVWGEVERVAATE